MPSKEKKSRRVFRVHNGPGPWPCFFCPDDVTPEQFYDWEVRQLDRKDRGVVHHVDHNHSNNHPDNLRAAHYGCHSDHHVLTRAVVASRVLDNHANAL